MRELSSKLGLVFEGAFKIGLLEEIEQKRALGFRKTLFEKLIYEGLDSSLVGELQKPVEEWGRIGTYIDENVSAEKYTKVIFLLGLYSGRLYGQSHKEAKLIRCELGEESNMEVWQNADLIFREGNTLYFVDFKLAGSAGWIRKLFTEGRNVKEGELPYMPVVNQGIPVNVSLGEMDFMSFLESFFEVEDALRDIDEVFMEVKGFSQLLCYATDYLTDVGAEGAKEICLELIYPIPESYRARFYLKELPSEKLKHYREKARELYKKLKTTESQYDILEKSVGVRPGKREKIHKKLTEEIKAYHEEIKKREETPYRINADSIDEVRKDVENRLKEFWEDSQECKAIALLHSAGGGKTSSARKLILNDDGKHIVLYMATRLSLLGKEFDHVRDFINREKREDMYLIYERSSPAGRGLKRHTGQGFEDVGNRKGILKRTVDAIMEAVRQNKYRQIWAFATIQALVETDYGSTAEHLKKLLRPNLRDYQLHFILDEFLGYKNGLFAVRELFKLLEELQKYHRKANLYIFDANGYSPLLLERLLLEFEEYEVVPDSIILCPFRDEHFTTYKGIPFRIHAKHGYPSRELLVYKKFFEDIDSKEKLVEHMASYIEQTFKERNKSAFVFVQDKELITYLSYSLKKRGLTTLVATASSRKSQEQINQGKEDVIIGTSAVSRGLDFSRPQKPVSYIYILVSDWGIEQNLVEILQAISRARGDKATEKGEKHLHLLYPIEKEKDYTVENLLNMVEFKDRELVKLIYRKEYIKQKLTLDDVVSRIVEQFLKRPQDKVLVPVPAQHIAVYRPNRLTVLESIVSFLEDIYLMESIKNEKVGKAIYDVLRNFYSAVSLYTNHVPSRIDSSGYRYYHPYVLVKGNLHLSFNNEKRKEIEKLLNVKPSKDLQPLKDILKEHNSEKVEEMERFLQEVTKESYKVAFLLPVYSWVFVNHVLGNEKDRELRFVLRSRVGRGGAVTLGGRMSLLTRCHTPESGVRKYGVVPLGEDYPYKEVLSGRFAKFPIEFVKKLQEVNNE